MFRLKQFHIFQLFDLKFEVLKRRFSEQIKKLVKMKGDKVKLVIDNLYISHVCNSKVQLENHKTSEVLWLRW